MKVNQWTLGLAAAGVVSLGSVAQAEEAANQVLTAVSATTLSGYVSTSGIWKPGTGNAYNTGAVKYGLRAYDGGKQDQFNLDVVKLTVSKKLDESEWAAGYTADILIGPDAVTFGTGTAGDNVAIQQAFVELRAPVGNGLNLKMGVFNTPIGYEAFDYTANPNYSRSYGYILEPTTYTGLIASYKVADSASIWAGIANVGTTGTGVPAAGYNANAGGESSKTYMAGVTLTAPADWAGIGGSTLNAGMIDHQSGAGSSDVQNFYVGVNVKTPLEGLSVGASYDYQGRSNLGTTASAAGTTAASFHANAFGVYASYAVTEKVKFHLRGEYAEGSNGVFYNSDPLGLNPGDARNEIIAGTATLEYGLWDNVLSRLEVRWDAAVTGGSQSAAAGSNKPFGVQDKNNITVALNLVYKF
jgi:hypothetical protein